MMRSTLLMGALWLVLVSTVLIAAGICHAAPSVTSVSGQVTHGLPITITGSNFGTKSTAAPVKYDDFDSGSVGADLVGWHLLSNAGLNPKYSSTRSHNGSQCGRASFESQYNCSAYADNLDLTTVYASYWVYWEKLSGDDTRNMKLGRFTAHEGNYKDGNPKMGYTGLNASGGTWYLNNGDGYETTWGYYVVGDTWCRIEMYFVASSSPGVADGTWAFWKNCSQLVNEQNYVTIAVSADRSFVRNFILPFYCAHDPGGPHVVYYDDVYLDSTQARAEIGNAATWSGCSHREVQVASAWSGSSITATVNQGTFTTGSTAYLYVVDADGSMNTSGYPVTVGPTTYALTVTNGSGSGDYDEDEVVPISANPPASGKAFAIWVGDFAYIADRFQAATTVTMPAANVSVTAAYVNVYTLTVNSGSGDGQYTAGTVVDISADAAPSGKEFDQWIGDTANVADTEAASTKFAMSAMDAEITATYTDIPPSYWPGDVNKDFFVGGTDLDYILGDWGHSGTEIIYPAADINNDGFVGGTDLDYVLADWGKSGSPP